MATYNDVLAYLKKMKSERDAYAGTVIRVRQKLGITGTSVKTEDAVQALLDGKDITPAPAPAPPSDPMPPAPSGWKTIASLANVNDLSQFTLYGEVGKPWPTTKENNTIVGYWGRDHVRARNGELQLVSREDGPNGMMCGGACMWKGENSNAIGKYGRWEYDSRCDAGVGTGLADLLWPTKDDTWPMDGELDIREFGPSMKSGGIAAWHLDKTKGSNRAFKVSLDGIDWTKWHRIAQEWSPEYVAVFIDGKEIGRLTDKSYIPTTLPMRLTFQQEYISWGVAPASSFPAETVFRYKNLRYLVRS